MDVGYKTPRHLAKFFANISVKFIKTSYIYYSNHSKLRDIPNKFVFSTKKQVLAEFVSVNFDLCLLLNYGRLRVTVTGKETTHTYVQVFDASSLH